MKLEWDELDLIKKFITSRKKEWVEFVEADGNDPECAIFILGKLIGQTISETQKYLNLNRCAPPKGIAILQIEDGERVYDIELSLYGQKWEITKIPSAIAYMLLYPTMDDFATSLKKTGWTLKITETSRPDFPVFSETP